jgi:Xaa-Pro aminopeptidase
MDSPRYHDRLRRVQRELPQWDAAWLLVPPSADFRWLTGAVARSSERLVALALPAEGDPFCLVPRLEADSLKAECPSLELEVWDDHEDPVRRLVSRLGLAARPRLLLAEGLRVTTVLDLAARTDCRPAADLLGAQRLVKDAEEIRALEAAGRHADQVVEEAADFMRPGMTERQVERFVLQRFDELGDGAAWAIVASGPHSALPHHMTSGRKLADGDVVVLDVGATVDGYGSDITRTFWLGAPPAEAERVYGVVDHAQRAGVAACKNGATAGAVDLAARAVIEAAGYGPYFTHRTGHGVGLEIHEPPYLVAGSAEPLRTGMVHSVEPGIYLPARFGVRIEDLVVVGQGGAASLNHAPRDPLPLRVRG